jgi:hypothetical protein
LYLRLLLAILGSLKNVIVHDGLWIIHGFEMVS